MLLSKYIQTVKSRDCLIRTLFSESFFDVLVHKQIIPPKTTVYIKPANTGQYLHFESIHNLIIKLGVTKILYDRVTNIFSNTEDRNYSIISQKALIKMDIPKRYSRLPDNTRISTIIKNGFTGTIASIIP